MSRQAIPAIANDDLDIAASAILGLEKRVFYALEDVIAVGEVSQSAADGTLSADPTFVADAAGLDMQVSLLNAVKSDVSIVLTFGVTFDDASTGTATATFVAPDWARDQSFNFPIGLAVDLIGTGYDSDKKIKTIDSLDSLAGGSAGARYGIISAPDEADYIQLPCVKNVNPMPPTSESVPIPCGYQAARWTKKGREATPTLSITSADPGAIESLNRLNGFRVTIKLEIVKDDRIMTSRQIYGGWRPKVTPTLPDGNGEAEVTAEGPYETAGYGIFC